MFPHIVDYDELNPKKLKSEKNNGVFLGSWSKGLDSVFCHLFITITDCTLVVLIALSNMNSLGL